MDKSIQKPIKSKQHSQIQFTGERMVPYHNKGMALFYEHISRYLFSLQFARNARVLDVGCGEGYGSYVMAKYGNAKQIIGIDNSADAVEHAKKRYQLKEVIYQIDNAENISNVGKEKFDIIVAFELIEHLSKQEKFLSRIKEVLKYEGTFVVSTPNKDNYPSGNPYHIKELKVSEFYSLLKKHFKYVELFYQFFELAEVIKRTDTPNIKIEEDFVSASTTAYYPLANKENSQYVIAVCSDIKIPEIKTNIVSTNKVDAIDLTTGLDHFNQGLLHLLNEQRYLNVIRGSKFYKLWRFYSGIKDRIYGK